MIIYIETDENNVVTGYGTSPFSEKCIEIEAEEFHTDLEKFGQFKYEDGELVRMSESEIENLYDIQEPPTDIERLEQALMELAMITMWGGE